VSVRAVRGFKFKMNHEPLEPSRTNSKVSNNTFAFVRAVRGILFFNRKGEKGEKGVMVSVTF
jgi:hypothetical protein